MKKSTIAIIFIIIIFNNFAINLQANNNVHAWYYIWYHKNSVYHHWGTQGCGVATGTPIEMTNISSDFYPVKGSYFSSDLDVVTQHAREMRRAGVNVAVISLWRNNVLNEDGSFYYQGINVIKSYTQMLCSE